MTLEMKSKEQHKEQYKEQHKEEHKEQYKALGVGGIPPSVLGDYVGTSDRPEGRMCRMLFQEGGLCADGTELLLNYRCVTKNIKKLLAIVRKQIQEYLAGRRYLQ